MKLFTARSKKLISIVRIVLYSLKVFGLAPFSISMKNLGQVNPRCPRIRAFGFSKIGLAYNLLLLIPVIYIAVSDFMNLFSDNDSSNSSSSDYNIKFLLRIVQKILTTLTASIILISWGFWQEKSASVLNHLLEVDVQLSRLERQPFNKQALIFLTIHVIINLLIWTSFWTTEIMENGFHNIFFVFFFDLPEYISYWFFIEYFTAIGLVATDMETVNNYLLNFQEFENRLSRPPNQVGHLAVVDLSSQYRSQLASLQLLHIVRTILVDLCEDIADFFSLPILFCISCRFFVLLYYLYILIIVEGLISSTVGNAVWKLIAIFSNIYPIMSLAANVARTEREARRTGRMVHKLLSTAIRPEIRRELEEFSLHLLHQNASFTAYGFFPLDFTLPQSMLGGLATYFIIAMQLSGSCTCDESSH